MFFSRADWQHSGRITAGSVEQSARSGVSPFPERRGKSCLPSMRLLALAHAAVDRITSKDSERQTELNKTRALLPPQASSRPAPHQVRPHVSAAQELPRTSAMPKRSALTFVLTLEDPYRFEKSRTVGSYLGLRPRQRESGEIAPQLGISKRATAISAGCWSRRLTISSGRWRRTAGCVGGDCNWPNEVGRTGSGGQWWQWREGWRFCFTGSG